MRIIKILIILFLIHSNYQTINYDQSWYRHLYDKNLEGVHKTFSNYIFAPDHCIKDIFAEGAEIHYGLGLGYSNIKYTFSYFDKSFKIYDPLSNEKVAIFIIQKDKVRIKYSISLERNNIVYGLIYYKSYIISDKTATYEMFFGKDENSGILKNIPPDQLPEELKNIDYKTKIDEIDKLLEERWNKACGTKVSK